MMTMMMIMMTTTTKTMTMMPDFVVAVFFNTWKPDCPPKTFGKRSSK